MSFFDRGNALAVTPDGYRCQSREQREWHGCRATTGVKSMQSFISNHIIISCITFRSRKILL